MLDLAAIQDANALRVALHDECSDGRCVWIRLGGLSVVAIGSHRALFHSLLRFGLGTDPVANLPSRAVLEWSTVETCTADGLAFFSALEATLRSLGVDVIVCGPADGDVAAALETSGIRGACSGQWLVCPCNPPRRVEVVGRAALFPGSEGGSTVAEFALGLHRALAAMPVGPVSAGRLVAATVDLLQNVLSHSGATHACAIAQIYRRKRPPEIEIGIADNGQGIVTNVLGQVRHSRLHRYTDAGIASVVLTQGLSGRDEEAGGGGLTGLIKGLVDECGATVVVRSEAALVRFAPGCGRAEPVHLSYGWGTQTLIRMRLTR